MAYDSPQLAHSIKQQEVVIPDLTIKELLDAIPWVADGRRRVPAKNLTKIFRAHCFKRNGWRSSLYMSVLCPIPIC